MSQLFFSEGREAVTVEVVPRDCLSKPMTRLAAATATGAAISGSSLSLKRVSFVASRFSFRNEIHVSSSGICSLVSHAQSGKAEWISWFDICSSLAVLNRLIVVVNTSVKNCQGKMCKCMFFILAEKFIELFNSFVSLALVLESVGFVIKCIQIRHDISHLR